MELEKEKIYTEEEYESFDHDGLLEFANGYIIAMSPPNRLHQKISFELGRRIGNYLEGKLCEIYHSPFNVKLKIDNEIIRVEPDISIICDKNKLNDKGCEGAPDFIIEVVSPGNKMHDYATKVNWYKKAGVKEYWIVNPMAREVLTYRFFKNDVDHYTFDNRVYVSIWNEDFSIDFKNIDLS